MHVECDGGALTIAALGDHLEQQMGGLDSVTAHWQFSSSRAGAPTSQIGKFLRADPVKTRR